MLTDAEIIREYERNEKAALQLARDPHSVDFRQIAIDTADQYGLEYERVRDVLSRHWVGLGG